MIISDMFYAVAAPYIGGLLGVILGAIFVPMAMDSKARRFKLILGYTGVTFIVIYLFKGLDPTMVFKLTESNLLGVIWSLPDTAKYGALGMLAVNIKLVVSFLPFINKNKGASK